MSDNKVWYTIPLDSCRLIYRNFQGLAREFNEPGRRNFCALLDKLPIEDVQKFEEDGWKIRWLQPREDGDLPIPMMKVNVSYKASAHDPKNPKIFLITHGRHPVLLSEASVGQLDTAEIINVDLEISPYNWVKFPGTKKEETGVSGYVKTMYVTIASDPFEHKYFPLPDKELADMAGPEDD